MVIASIYPFPFYIGHGHDVNFSLIKDGDIYSCEEGKINEVVMDQYDRFPEKAMLAGFKEFNITASDVDIWVFGQPHLTPVEPALRFFFSEFKAKPYDELLKAGAIRYVNHHLAHATQAVYGSGINDGMYLTLDGDGDEADPHDSSWGIFSGNEIQQLGASAFRGTSCFHNYICDAIGYLGNVDNGKAMGLASYGQIQDALYQELSKYLIVDDSGLFAKCLFSRTKASPYRLSKFKMDAYHRYKSIHSPSPSDELREITKYYSAPDIAATGQKVYEDVSLQVVKNLLKETGQTNLVCSGGAFQNISLNRKLMQLAEIEKLYVPNGPNDAGLSLGAALNVFMKESQSKRPPHLISPYLGPSFKNEEIKKLIDEYNLVYEEAENINPKVAALLVEGKVVGWFQGRAELGPRALGARSVLADPRKLINKARINQLLKRRDWFMPYAPSVLYEHMDKVYQQYVESPYMSFAFEVKPEYADKIPAAVHVDGTSRPNSVRREANAKYYDLICEFEKLTGIPLVLNTSFNRHGIATIVYPRQAFEHLLNGCLDVLAIGDYLVYPERRSTEINQKIYGEDFFILVEELFPIIDAMLNSSIAEAGEILEFNKNKLQSYGISIALDKKEIEIGGDSIQISTSERKELQEILFAFLEKNQSGLHSENLRNI